MKNFNRIPKGKFKYSFKEGDFVICKNNLGFKDQLIIGKKYKVIRGSYNEWVVDMIDIIGENEVLTGLFASRFTTLKIERKEKLINIDKKWKQNH